MTNGNGMKAGEFRGKVLTHLEYIKDEQDKQSESIKELNDTLIDHIEDSGKAIAVLKKVSAIMFAWLTALTGIITKILWR